MSPIGHTFLRLSPGWASPHLKQWPIEQLCFLLLDLTTVYYSFLFRLYYSFSHSAKYHFNLHSFEDLKILQLNQIVSPFIDILYKGSFLESSHVSFFLILQFVSHYMTHSSVFIDETILSTLQKRCTIAYKINKKTFIEQQLLSEG